jgi:hypothetical protein
VDHLLLDNTRQALHRRGENIMFKLNEETKFWMRLAAFAHTAEYLLSTGAPIQDAEEVLFGWCLPGSLPLDYGCLTGGMAYRKTPQPTA